MRGALVYHLLSGQAWLSAGSILVLVLAAELAGSLAARPALRAAARIAFLLSIGVAALSGTPVPLWLLVPLVTSLGALAATGFRSERSAAGRLAAGLSIALVAAAMLAEGRWQRMPRLEIPPGTTVAVLGDSLSSGGFGDAAPWPARFAAKTSVPVTNLSLPGETVRSAIEYQLPRLAGVTPPTVVLIELGGNDLLGGTAAAQYAATLDRLLEGVRREQPAAIVMFELPIPPGRWRWGAIQRRAAQAHGVALIPKRVLARALTNPRFVDDGLHLTDEGHEALARDVGRSLQVR